MLRVWDVPAGTGEDHELSDALRLDLIPGREEYFAVRHRGDDLDRVIAVTAHTFSDPATAVAGVLLRGASGEPDIEGDREVWKKVPGLIPLEFPYVLAIGNGGARVQRIEVRPGWADPEYPPLITGCPDGRTLIVTASGGGGELLVYDLPSAQRIAALDVGGGGLRVLRFRDAGRDLWVANHDQIHRIDTQEWRVVDGVRLRNDTSGSFVNDFSFDGAERRCAVSYALRRPDPIEGDPQYPLAVPAGGRILVFDVDSFKVTHASAADSPEWIDEVALLSDGSAFGLTRENEQWQSSGGSARPDKPRALSTSSPGRTDLALRKILAVRSHPPLCRPRMTSWRRFATPNKVPAPARAPERNPRRNLRPEAPWGRRDSNPRPPHWQ
jgi:hypothetical protein